MFEKYSTCLGIREMQIKVVLRFCPIPLRMASMKRTKGANVSEDLGKEEPSFTADDKLAQPLWKSASR